MVRVPFVVIAVVAGTLLAQPHIFIYLYTHVLLYCYVALILQARESKSKRRRNEDAAVGEDEVDNGGEGGEGGGGGSGSTGKRVIKKAKRAGTQSKDGANSQRKATGGKSPSPCGFVNISPEIGLTICFLSIHCRRVWNRRLVAMQRVVGVLTTFPSCIVQLVHLYRYLGKSSPDGHA